MSCPSLTTKYRSRSMVMLFDSKMGAEEDVLTPLRNSALIRLSNTLGLMGLVM